MTNSYEINPRIDTNYLIFSPSFPGDDAVVMGCRALYQSIVSEAKEVHLHLQKKMLYLQIKFTK